MADVYSLPGIEVAPSPHVAANETNTRRMMIDVIVGLTPVLLMAIVVFQWYAVVQVGLCVLTCLATEALCARMRGYRIPLGDYSAAATGVILGLSLPALAPWYVGVIGSAVAIALGKFCFGGLGHNLFNPAMVGRAFVMLSFAKELGSSAYVVVESKIDVMTHATPLTIARQFAADLAAGTATTGDVPLQLRQAQELWPLFVGQVNGSLGETSALALLIGGIYLCVRRAAAWEIPLGMCVMGVVCAGLANWTDLTPFSALRHLVSGSFLMGAFFIATDPVTSPVTPKGRFVFGLGIGFLVVVMRVFSGYPEGLMFAVLMMNAAVPLLNRWTVPKPLGLQ